MSDFDWVGSRSDDLLMMRYSMGIGIGSHRLHAVIRPEPGALPQPLEDAANEMYDAKSDSESKMAAQKFLTLSEEWVDSA